MTPIRFGAGAHLLYGVLHEPEPDAFAGRGVVLCGAFGQEAIRSHRVLRVLADRLARAGIAAIRFDPHGTGESDGDDDEVSMADWCADVHAADAELRARLGVRHAAWLGLRLGAALAALASRRAPAAPERLILWDAVTDGRAFLAQAARSHVAGLARAFPALAFAQAADDAVPAESMGFVLPAAFAAEVASIDAALYARVGAARLAWIDDRAPDARPPAAAPVAVSHHRCGSIDWSTDEAMNAAIVPADVVAAVLHEALGR